MQDGLWLKNSTIQLQIAKAANAILCSENSTTAGVVVTHGTDTLEVTAFFREKCYNLSGYSRSAHAKWT